MKQQKLKKRNNVPLGRVVLALLLMFWLSAHVDIARALYHEVVDVSSKPLHIFIFMNFIIFALCLLSSSKQIHQISPSDHVVYHDINVGCYKKKPEVIVESLPKEVYEEEMLLEVEDKHVILVEKANVGGEIVAVPVSSYADSDDDDELSLGRNRRRGQLELRRLERGLSKELVITMREPPWRSTTMDDMSNEEFRFAIEAFIGERNKAMMQEEERYIYPLCVSTHYSNA